MRRFFYFAIFTYLILQIQTNEATLIAAPRVHAVSACLGDSVDLEVEITQSNGTISVTWRHGTNVLTSNEQYKISSSGKRLTMIDILPPQAGVYSALVSDGKNTVNVGFTVEVKDLFLNINVPNTITIAVGKSHKLDVDKSKDGVLWWVRNGAIITSSKHYKIEGADGNILEIINARAEHAGIYEVILKSGSCEKRNLIQVNVGKHTYSSAAGSDANTAGSNQEFVSDDKTTLIIMIVLGYLTVAMVCLILLLTMDRLRECFTGKTSTDIESSSAEDDKETTYDKENIYETMTDLDIHSHRKRNATKSISDSRKGSNFSKNPDKIAHTYDSPKTVSIYDHRDSLVPRLSESRKGSSVSGKDDVIYDKQPLYDTPKNTSNYDHRASIAAGQRNSRRESTVSGRGDAIYDTSDFYDTVSNYNRRDSTDSRRGSTVSGRSDVIYDTSDVYDTVSNYNRRDNTDSRKGSTVSGRSDAIYDTSDVYGTVSNHKRRDSTDSRRGSTVSGRSDDIYDTSDVYGTVSNHKRRDSTASRRGSTVSGRSDDIYDTSEVYDTVSNYNRRDSTDSRKGSTISGRSDVINNDTAEISSDTGITTSDSVVAVQSQSRRESTVSGNGDANSFDAAAGLDDSSDVHIDVTDGEAQ